MGGGGAGKGTGGQKRSASTTSTSSVTKEVSPSGEVTPTPGESATRRGAVGVMIIPSLKVMAVDLYIVHDPTSKEIAALKKLHDQLTSCVSLLVPSIGTAKVCYRKIAYQPILSRLTLYNHTHPFNTPYQDTIAR